MGQGRDHHERFDTKAGLMDLDLDFPHLNRLRHAFVGGVIHPRGLGGPRPGHQMIAVAQTLAAAKVGAACLMQARHHINASFHQQRDHEVGTVVTIAQDNVAQLEPIEELPQQGRLAGFLARTRPQVHALNHGRRQGHQHHHACQRKTHPLGLRGGLRIIPLVLGRVRHAHGSAIDKVDVSAVPQPVRRQFLLTSVRHRQRQSLDDHDRQLGAGSAVGAGVVGAGLLSQRNP